MTHRLCLIALLAVTAPALAGTYKWTDENGKVHYGDTIPPQYVNRGITQIDSRGLVVKRIEAVPTAEQQKARADELARKTEEDRRAAEQRRRDQALIGTYSSEQEIDLARERNTQYVDSLIRAARERQVQAQAALREANQQLEFYKGKDKASGKPRVAPTYLVSQVAEAHAASKALDGLIDELGRQREEVVQRFADHKKRYRELELSRMARGGTSSDPKVSRL